MSVGCTSGRWVGLCLVMLLGGAPASAQVLLLVPGEGDGRSVPESFPADEFETGHSYEWYRDGPACVESKSILDVPRELSGQAESLTRRFGQLPDEDEVKLGIKMFETFKGLVKGRLDREEHLVKYANQVARLLVEHVGRPGIPYEVHVLSDEKPNAFCLPGGHIVVTTAMLLKALANEAQLAGVLGHEIAHVDKRHCVSMYQYVRLVLGQGGDELVPLVQLFLRMPFSHHQETEADLKGASLAIKVGYSPYQTVAFLGSLPSPPSVTTEPPPMDSPFKLAGYVIRGGMEEMENLVSTHPRSSDRACRLKKALYAKDEKLKNKRFFIGRSRYEERLVRPADDME